MLADQLRPAGEGGLIHVGSGSRLSLPTESKLVDVGDYNSYPTDMDRAVEGMAGGVYEVVKRGGFSVCLGGDHFVGYPSCLGFTRAAAELNPNVRVGYIHIDGHLDFTDITPLFGKYSNGTNARRISEIEVVSPKNMVWIGIDGYVNAEQADTIKRNGATVFTGLDVQDMGPVEVARRAGELAIDGCDYIYLSMDIDVVDSGFSPGTGSPVFAAITPMMAMRMLWELSKFPIGSMDFCETSPRLDPTPGGRPRTVESMASAGRQCTNTSQRPNVRQSKFPIGSMDFCETSPRLDPTDRSNMLAPQFIGMGIIRP